jgi:hypothetical protein
VSGRDDDFSEMTTDDAVAGATELPPDVTRLIARDGYGDDADAVTRFLDELGSYGDAPPPEPSAELAAILDGRVALLDLRRGLLRRHRTGLAVAAAGVVLLSATGISAAKDRLPQPAQRYVSNVVNVLTPFHVDPSDAVPTPAHHAPLPAGSTSPAPPRSPSRPPVQTDEPTPGGTTGAAPEPGEDGTRQPGTSGPASEPAEAGGSGYGTPTGTGEPEGGTYQPSTSESQAPRESSSEVPESDR